MPPQSIVVTLIRKGDVTDNVRAILAATEDGYALTGLPSGLLEGSELLAVVVHLVENEAGYLPADEREEANGKRH
jgi:hypothetical protein